MGLGPAAWVLFDPKGKSTQLLRSLETMDQCAMCLVPMWGNAAVATIPAGTKILGELDQEVSRR